MEFVTSTTPVSSHQIVDFVHEKMDTGGTIETKTSYWNTHSFSKIGNLSAP